jgi:hypothetical protein
MINQSTTLNPKNMTEVTLRDLAKRQREAGHKPPIPVLEGPVLAEWLAVRDRAGAKRWYLNNTPFTNEQIEEILDWMEVNPELCTKIAASPLEEAYLKSI